MLAEYGDGSTVSITGFVESVTERKTKNNKKFVQFSMSKNGKSARCFIWNKDLASLDIKQNDILEVKGSVNLYKEQFKSLNVFSTTKIEATEELMQELLPHLPDEEIEAYKTEINELIKGIENKKYKKLLTVAFKKFGSEIFESPAASKVHQNYRNGLIEHTIAVTNNAIGLASTYRTSIDMDLLVCAALLHDIGKIKNYFFNKFTIEYTIQGCLMDHIAGGIEIINDLCEKHKINLTDEERMMLKHCILSHHGSVDKGWGSCVSPAIPEALIVHTADMLDSQLSIMLDDIDGLTAGEKTKDRNYFLKNYVYRKLGED